MEKQLRQRILRLYYYWQGVDIAPHSIRELATAGLNAELLLTILKMSASELEVVPCGEQVKAVAVRCLAYLRTKTPSEAYSNDPEAVSRARRAIISLAEFQASPGDWRRAEVVTYHSGVPAAHISHDTKDVREVRRQAIVVTWANPTWYEEKKWYRWIKLQQWLHNSGLKPEDVGIDAATFQAEYRRAAREHWAPALYDGALYCKREIVCERDHLHTTNPTRTARRVMALVGRGILSSEEVLRLYPELPRIAQVQT